jgi:hypothetical protein
MTENSERVIEHDRLFKELISTFFWEFLELFFPDLIPYIDQSSITFLPQEVFIDITSGNRREVDLLAKVRFREQESFFLIHTETQSYAQADFARRMFHYFARLDEKYALPVYPIALFSFDTPQRLEPNNYQVEFPDRKVLEFSYAAIQLNRLNWRDFLRQQNPVAAALMAKMRIEPQDRPQVKAECLRLLVTLRLDPARNQLISGFIDSYLRLNSSEKVVFTEELNRLGLIQEERFMEIVTSWMEQGIEQGIERGIEQGIERGIEQGLQREITFILRLLSRRLGTINPEIQDQIRRLPIELVEELGEALLDFETDSDLLNWLAENCS